MRSKRLVSLVLVGAMATTAVAGCSKSKTRKIEGASDDVASFVGVMEETLDMKGIKGSIVMDINSQVDSEAGETSVSGKITVDTIMDSDSNISEKINLDIKAGNYSVKGDVATLSYIGNTVYVDLSGAYSIATDLLGSATLTALIDKLELTEESIKKSLCISISTGDLKSSDFGIEKIKDIALKINDDYAKALTDAKAVTKDKDTYTIKLTEETAKALASGFVSAFESNGSEIYDLIVEKFGNDDFKNKVISMIKAIYGEVNSAMASIMGTESESEFDTTDIDKMFSSLKDDKDANLSKLIEQMKNSLSSSSENSANVDVKDLVLVVTDEKDGYSVKMDIDTSAAVSENSASVKANMTATVTSTDEKVTAPAEASSISDVVNTFLPIITSFLMSSLSGVQE